MNCPHPGDRLNKFIDAGTGSLEARPHIDKKNAIEGRVQPFDGLVQAFSCPIQDFDDRLQPFESPV